MLRSRPLFRLLKHNYRVEGSSLKPSSLLHNLQSLSSFSTSASATWPPKLPMRKLFFGFLKFGSFSALAGTTYVTCAYSLDELDDKTLLIRKFTSRRRAPEYGNPDFLAGGIKKKNKSLSDGDPAVLHPLEFKSPFISTVMTVVGEAIYAYLIVRLATEVIIKEYSGPRPDKLLPDPVKHDLYTLVLDLNETLVHSDWNTISNDLVQRFKIEDYTFKRPGFDAFLERVNELGFEVVLYTDENLLNVLPLHHSLKPKRRFQHVLTMGSIFDQNGKLYRDLSKLNRDPSRILYVSGHALENCLQSENCIPIKPWRKEVDDTTLTDLLPLLDHVSYERPSDIRPLLSHGRVTLARCSRTANQHSLERRELLLVGLFIGPKPDRTEPKLKF